MEYWWIPVTSAIIGASVVICVEYLSRVYVVGHFANTSKDGQTQRIYEIWTRFDPLNYQTQTQSSKVSTTSQAKAHSTQETGTQTEEVISPIKTIKKKEDKEDQIAAEVISTKNQQHGN